MAKKRTPAVAAPEWTGALLSDGRTLGEVTKKQRVLLVFLRHSG